MKPNYISPKIETWEVEPCSPIVSSLDGEQITQYQQQVWVEE